MYKLFYILLLVSSLSAEDALIESLDSFDSTYNAVIENTENMLNEDSANDVPQENEVLSETDNKLQIEENDNIREHELRLIIILSVSVIIILWLMLKYLIREEEDNYNLIRLCGIFVILFMIGFVVLIVEDSTQLSAIIGLLGAIAGYFLKEGKELLIEQIQKNKN